MRLAFAAIRDYQVAAAQGQLVGEDNGEVRDVWHTLLGMPSELDTATSTSPGSLGGDGSRSELLDKVFLVLFLFAKEG